jgi:hypothetical protein
MVPLCGSDVAVQRQSLRRVREVLLANISCTVLAAMRARGAPENGTAPWKSVCTHCDTHFADLELQAAIGIGARASACTTFTRRSIQSSRDSQETDAKLP